MLTGKELIDAFQAALQDFDREAMSGLLTEDAEYVNPPYAAEPGTRRGREAVLGVFDVLSETFEWDASDTVEVVEAGDEILLLWSGPLRMRRIQSTELPGRGAFLFRRRGDRVAAISWFLDHEEGRAAMGGG